MSEPYDHKKTSQEYLDAWKLKQSQMQAYRDRIAELEAELQALRRKKAQESEREASEDIADAFRLLANLRGTDLQELFLKGADPEVLIPKNDREAYNTVTALLAPKEDK